MRFKANDASTLRQFHQRHEKSPFSTRQFMWLHDFRVNQVGKWDEFPRGFSLLALVVFASASWTASALQFCPWCDLPRYDSQCPGRTPTPGCVLCARTAEREAAWYFENWCIEFWRTFDTMLFCHLFYGEVPIAYRF
jgi:hypothetical protein